MAMVFVDCGPMLDVGFAAADDGVEVLFASNEQTESFTPASAHESGDPNELAEQMAAALARGCRRPMARRDAQSVVTFTSGELLAGRYAVERFLARGGMGEVYVALDRECGRRRAIKTVLSTQGDDVTAVRRLIREVRLARRVRHVNVCRVHGAGIHAPSPRDVVHFMIMDLLDGPSLRAWRRMPGRSLQRSLLLARQVLLGLEAVHAAGIVHGDLKSDNVVVEEGEGEARAVLVDFGLSQRLDGTQRPTGAMRSGSLGYMAPEQISGGVLSARTDIFAFGVVLFELLTGALPFHAGAEQGDDGLAAVRERCRAALPPVLATVVERCLSHEPAARFPSARGVLEALEPCEAML